MFPQGPGGLPDVSSPQLMVSTLVAVYYPTLLFLGVLVFGPYQHLCKGSVSFEVGLYSICGAYLFGTFPQARNVWNGLCVPHWVFPWGL